MGKCGEEAEGRRRPEQDGPVRKIALGKRLRDCPPVRCVGVSPNWDDYPDPVKEALLSAEKIYYPTRLYGRIFTCLGKKVFPRNYYTLIGNKIAQTGLFQFLAIPHPRTRIYYGGGRRAEKIRATFPFPFIAKTPFGSSRGEGVFLIEDREDLAAYLASHNPAYIQELLPIDRDLRVVVIAGRIVNAYWRIHREGDFRNNVAQGASISFEAIPAEALEFAAAAAARCGFDEVALDICHAGGRYYLLEANMAYGLEGFKRKGLDMRRVFADLAAEGVL
jgi:ribosomal protein S6--L-glutamate ligase